MHFSLSKHSKTPVLGTEITRKGPSSFFQLGTPPHHCLLVYTGVIHPIKWTRPFPLFLQNRTVGLGTKLVCTYSTEWMRFAMLQNGQVFCSIKVIWCFPSLLKLLRELYVHLHYWHITNKVGLMLILILIVMIITMLFDGFGSYNEVVSIRGWHMSKEDNCCISVSRMKLYTKIKEWVNQAITGFGLFM